MTPSPASLWNCPGCLIPVTTAFCPGCGERPLTPSDFSLKGLLAQLGRSVAGVDGRVLRSVRMLITQPGALTQAYIQGRRRSLIGPFQLFFLANFAFFVVQSLTHTKIFSSPLDSHLHHQDWSELAQALLARHLQATHDTLARFTPVFDQAVVFNAKALVILMVLPFAAMLPLIFHRRGKPFAVHMTFALHQYALLLLLFCASLGVVAIDVALGGSGLTSARLDTVLTLIELSVCATHLFFSIKRIYGGSAWLRTLQAMVLTLAVGAIVLGYRFAIFLITLYGTSSP